MSGSLAVFNIPTTALLDFDLHFLHDLRSVYVGAYGVEGDTRLRIIHLGLEECGARARACRVETFSLLVDVMRFRRHASRRVSTRHAKSVRYEGF